MGKYLIKKHSNVIDANISLDRQVKNIQKAQLMLDLQIMNDMKPYMPLVNGTFIQRTSAESTMIAGTGEVVAGAAPFGRFLYRGKVMVGEHSGSPFAKKGERKVETGRELNFNKNAHPKVTPKWFEVAKSNHKKDWIALVNKAAGG